MDAIPSTFTTTPTTSARGTKHEVDASAEAAMAAGVEDGGLGVSVEGGRDLVAALRERDPSLSPRARYEGKGQQIAFIAPNIQGKGGALDTCTPPYLEHYKLLQKKAAQ